jgi:6-pyruvoyltetrahydropterin/6-carboxytetrahydropterin synthase
MAFKITKEMMTETAHRLNGHPGRCQFLHGHSYRWQVSLEGELGSDGMVADFSTLKQAMVAEIDKFDHALVLEGGLGDSIEAGLHWALIQAGLGERVVIVPYRPTAENMAKDVAHKIKLRYPEHAVTVCLWETVTSCAEYSIP